MKKITALVLIFVLVFNGCNQSPTVQENHTENNTVTESANDKEAIQTLIRQTLNWTNSKNTIDLLPVIADAKDSIYIGFDLNKHQENLNKLKETGFFATEFIDNYNQIILTLNKDLRNGKYGEWLVGDLPPFAFASDVDPWTLCQDLPYNNPSPWNCIEIETKQLNKDSGKLDWKWGNLGLNSDSGWITFRYPFSVIKENSKWKIAYLEGFNLKKIGR